MKNPLFVISFGRDTKVSTTIIKICLNNMYLYNNSHQFLNHSPLDLKT